MLKIKEINHLQVLEEGRTYKEAAYKMTQSDGESHFVFENGIVIYALENDKTISNRKDLIEFYNKKEIKLEMPESLDNTIEDVISYYK